MMQRTKKTVKCPAGKENINPNNETFYIYYAIEYNLVHLRSPRLLCVRSLGSPWYDYVYFNSALSGIQ